MLEKNLETNSLNFSETLIEIPLKGHSMWPFIISGDLLNFKLFATPKKMDQFSVGKILLVREQGEWVAHRLIEFKGKKVLKGDFSNSYYLDDEPVVWGELADDRGSSVIATMSAQVLNFEHSSELRKLIKLGIFFVGKTTRLFQKVF